jgi:hypothetical protein
MSQYAVYQNAAPYFDLVRGALGDLVDGKHFFDIITDNMSGSQLIVPGALATRVAQIMRFATGKSGQY